MSDQINDESKAENLSAENPEQNSAELGMTENPEENSAEPDMTENQKEDSDASLPKEKKHNRYKVLCVILAACLFVAMVFTGLFATGVLKPFGSQAEPMESTQSVTVPETKTEVTEAEETDAEATEEADATEAGTEEETAGGEDDAGTDAKTATFTVDFVVANSWGSGSATNYQYSVSVRNTSRVDIKTWGQIEADVPEGTSVTQAWGCEYELKDNKLILKPTEYTAEIAAGAVRGDIGLILESPGKMENFSCDGTTDSVASSSGSSDGGSSYPDPSTPVTPYEPPELEAGTPVGNHGQLSVKGTDLVDQNGKKFQLKGVSTHGIGWFPDYVNEDGFKTLRDNWGANLIRIAMYTDEYNGYCSGGNKEELEALVCKGVEACTDLGMYVIIDWHVLHDLNPNKNIDSAKVFFDRMSQKYAGNVNVIYEICNEPNGDTTWADIKKYADVIIPIIRKNSPNAVIIVGTPTWSQDVDQVAANPLKNGENVMYALHFYAATHKDDLRNKLTKAREDGTPIFISEFSICDASGNGGIDYDSAEKWKELINSENLSYAGWSLSNKAETSALINPSCTKLSGWESGDLSSTGLWLRDMISGK